MKPTAGSLIERFRNARSDEKRVVLEGFHAVKHALRFRAEFDTLVIADAARIDRLVESLAPDIARALAALPHTVVDRHTFDALMPSPPREPIAALAVRPAAAASTALAQRRDRPVVFLEEPAHLQNIGACVRVAAAADAAGVITSGTHDPWHAAALRGSAGLHFALPVARVDALDTVERQLIAFHPDGRNFDDVVLPGDAVYAFGSERRGLSQDLLARAAQRIAIPMRPGVSSLSIATAVAVALYARRALARQDDDDGTA
jgi:RNA methyltransferase, TrmH family